MDSVLFATSVFNITSWFASMFSGLRCRRQAPCAQRLVVLALAALLAGSGLPAVAREGVQVGQNSAFSRLVPAQQIESSSSLQYAQMLQQADEKNALDWNPRARDWKWEVNLIGSKQLNAFCMPGGKIVFYTGILDQLKLTDDEVAMIMGHEIAHALREHARERMGKSTATNIGVGLLSQVLGLGQVGQTVTNYGAQLLTLKFGREDESEADLVGMELAARAGFDPRAGVSLWQKMAAASKGAPPQWLSTHPAGSTRIADIQSNLPKVLPLYARAKKG